MRIRRSIKRSDDVKQGAANDRSRQKIAYGLLLGGTFASVLLGILLPGQILGRQRQTEFDQVAAVPSEYYSAANSAMARNASAQMGVYQKLQLITGQWESERKKPDSYELQLEEYEAVEYARKGIEELYTKGLYPKNLASDYGSWYIWEAEPLKAVDMIFHTYTAYYWCIRFTRYDGSQEHVVYLLEDGTLISAEYRLARGVYAETVKSAAEVEVDERLMTVFSANFEQRKVEDYLVDAGQDGTGLSWNSLTLFETRQGIYAVMQAEGSHSYLLTVTPYEVAEQ